MTKSEIRKKLKQIDELEKRYLDKQKKVSAKIRKYDDLMEKLQSSYNFNADVLAQLADEWLKLNAKLERKKNNG